MGASKQQPSKNIVPARLPVPAPIDCYKIPALDMKSAVFAVFSSELFIIWGEVGNFRFCVDWQISTKCRVLFEKKNGIRYRFSFRGNIWRLLSGLYPESFFQLFVGSMTAMERYGSYGTYRFFVASSIGLVPYGLFVRIAHRVDQTEYLAFSPGSLPPFGSGGVGSLACDLHERGWGGGSQFGGGDRHCRTRGILYMCFVLQPACGGTQQHHHSCGNHQEANSPLVSAAPTNRNVQKKLRKNCIEA